MSRGCPRRECNLLTSKNMHNWCACNCKKFYMNAKPIPLGHSLATSVRRKPRLTDIQKVKSQTVITIAYSVETRGNIPLLLVVKFVPKAHPSSNCRSTSTVSPGHNKISSSFVGMYPVLTFLTPSVPPDVEI